MFVFGQEISSAKASNELDPQVYSETRRAIRHAAPTRCPGKLLNQLDETRPRSARIIDYVSGMMCP